MSSIFEKLAAKKRELHARETLPSTGDPDAAPSTPRVTQAGLQAPRLPRLPGVLPRVASPASPASVTTPETSVTTQVASMRAPSVPVAIPASMRLRAPPAEQPTATAPVGLDFSGVEDESGAVYEVGEDEDVAGLLAAGMEMAIEDDEDDEDAEDSTDGMNDAIDPEAVQLDDDGKEILPEVTAPDVPDVEPIAESAPAPAPAPAIRKIVPLWPAASNKTSGVNLNPRPSAAPVVPPVVEQPSAPAVPPSAAPAPAPALSLPPGSILARMQQRALGQTSSAASAASASSISSAAQASLAAGSSASQPVYSPEDFKADWDDLPEVIDGSTDSPEYAEPRRALLAKAADRIQQVFENELASLRGPAANDLAIHEIGQLVKLTFLRVKQTPAAWELLALADKAKVIRGMTAMAAKRNSAVTSRKPRDAAALSAAQESLSDGFNDDAMLGALEASGFSMSFGEF